ncbi:ankyrin repeat-containing domain protein [Mycena maculata]|uniref:Ankyrin repeat-containing domain protein n=1 Tax=Mycena maculata TaxID=230809 RepID=A0AAD7IRP0_9AGAR|nr:ankyrin repeat-containing domain protein [Mycena maculata]
MSRDYFAEVPPELILLLPPLLSTSSLNAFALGCYRLCEILQPELESRITPELAQELLLWAAPSKPHIVAKLVSPPHSVNPNSTHGYLHVAVEAGNTETALLLLQAGADPTVSDPDQGQALRVAAIGGHVEMMKLLLDHGAPVDEHVRCHYRCAGSSESALHYACSLGHLEMMELLISRGANLESIGYHGTALGFAVRSFEIDAVKLLLRKGADATVTVPLFPGAALPPETNLLYIAMGLQHPIDLHRPCIPVYPPRFKSRLAPAVDLPEWKGLPMSEDQQQLMALLLAHGASKVITMQTISEHLAPLALTTEYTEEEYLEVVEKMIEQAENAVPDVLGALYDGVLRVDSKRKSAKRKEGRTHKVKTQNMDRTRMEEPERRIEGAGKELGMAVDSAL